ncbi:MAG: ABC transporter permease [Anaerolinea sp.]|nr:ABC transporter permease [Anaerolinea sp.]
MKRLVSAMRWDMRLQFRHGFYYAAAFVAVLFIIGLHYLPAVYWPLAMPVLVMGNMTMNTFYFMAALVLLEKDDGVLEGLVLTPLRQGEYLWAKLLSLALLTLVENGVIVTAVVGTQYNPLLLAAGILLLSFINALYGFMVVIRYESVNSFIFPSVFWTMLLSLPFLQYFGLVNTPLVYLHPVQAPLVLLTAAFQPMPAWTIAYGVFYGLLWVAILHRLARRAFTRFVILPRGLARVS